MDATTLSDRAVIRLSGEGVRDFLDGLVTSDISGDLPVWTGLLTPQGKCLFDFFVWADGDDLLLDCEAEAAEDLIKRLAVYRLRRKIEIARDQSLAVHWSPDGDEGVADPRLAQLGKRRLAASTPAKAGAQPEPEGREDVLRAPGPLVGLRPSATPQGDKYREHRLRLGVCEGRAELGDFLWLECNAAELNGVSFTKGCFVGQENTARMNWRGKVNRRLFVVQGGGDPKRTRAEYPSLGMSVVHARIDAIPDNAIIPDWLAPALAAPAEPAPPPQ
jgi:folate-binding protein YgfZ